MITCFFFFELSGSEKSSGSVFLVHESPRSEYLALHSGCLHFGLFDSFNGGSTFSLRMAESARLHISQQLRRESFFHGKLLLVHSGKFDATGIRPQSQGNFTLKDFIACFQVFIQVFKLSNFFHYHIFFC